MTQYRYPEPKAQLTHEKPIGPEQPVGGTPTKPYAPPGTLEKLKGVLNRVGNNLHRVGDEVDKLKANPTFNKAKAWAVERGRQINEQDNAPRPQPRPQSQRVAKPKRKRVVKPKRVLSKTYAASYQSPFNITLPKIKIPKHPKHIF